jgi:L-fucose isomerase-like protein
LPSYFPERHGVFEAARATLPQFAERHRCLVTFFPKVLIDGSDAEAALQFARSSGVDFILVLHGGFTMGDVARTLAESEFRLGFWAVPEPSFDGSIQLNNFVSLNMSLSIAAGARDLESRPVSWYFGDVHSAAFTDRLASTLAALRVLKAARGARIGIVGGVAPSFFNMQVHPGQLRRRWDITVVEFPIDALRAAASDVPIDAVRETRRAMVAAAGHAEAPVSELSARYAEGLRRLAADNRLDAVAVSDWPALQEDPGFHPGAAFSWLEENDGMAIASEGDALGALTQLAVVAVTGRPGCIVDLCAPRPQTARLLVWHGGGGPLYMAAGGSLRWIDHPMLGRGDPNARPVGTIADFRFAPGPVTLVRIGRDGDALFVMNANIVDDATAGFAGARGWLSGFQMGGHDLSLTDVIEIVMHSAIEHHFVLVPGRHGSAFSELATWSGAELVSPIREAGYLPAAPSKERLDR